MNYDPQKLYMARADRDALREYAWRNRTTMGAVARAAVEAVRDDPGNLDVLSTSDSPSEVQLSVKIDPAIWDAAKDAASKSGPASFSALVRRRIRKILIEEGYLK